MTIISFQYGNTIKDILNEQDFGLGKIGVSLVYWPTFVVLYIKSLLPINTKSCFDEMEDNELTSEQIRKKYPRFFDVGEHYISYVRNGVVEATIYESQNNFDDIVERIENLNCKKIRRFGHTLYIPKQ
jgi:hypothetical protein